MESSSSRWPAPVFYDPAMTSPQTQQAMKWAVEEARHTLCDYLEYYEDAPSYTFRHRLKICFFDIRQGIRYEHLWITDFSVDGDCVTGILESHPQILPLFIGDEVTAPLSHVVDWGFQAGSMQYGSYTVYALLDFLPPGEVQMYMDYYGFTENPLDMPGATFDELIEDLPDDLPDPAELDEDERRFEAEVERRVSVAMETAEEISPEFLLRTVRHSVRDLYQELHSDADCDEAEEFAQYYMDDLLDEDYDEDDEYED